MCRSLPRVELDRRGAAGVVGEDWSPLFRLERDEPFPGVLLPVALGEDRARRMLHEALRPRVTADPERLGAARRVAVLLRHATDLLACLAAVHLKRVHQLRAAVIPPADIERLQETRQRRPATRHLAGLTACLLGRGHALPCMRHRSLLGTAIMFTSQAMDLLHHLLGRHGARNARSHRCPQVLLFWFPPLREEERGRS